jgi:hypothetical protein
MMSFVFSPGVTLADDLERRALKDGLPKKELAKQR